MEHFNGRPPLSNFVYVTLTIFARQLSHEMQTRSLSCAMANRNDAHRNFFLHLRSDIQHLCRSIGVGDFSKSADAAAGDASLTRI